MTSTSETFHSARFRKVLQQAHADIQPILAKYGATDVKLFGSVARGDATLHSDIDLLVSIPGPAYEQVVSMLALADELTALLGTKVDVVARGVAKEEVTAALSAVMVDV